MHVAQSVRHSRHSLRGQRCMEVPEQWAQIRYALDYDCTNDLGRVPDVGMGVTPEVPLVFDVALVLPAGSDGGDDGYYHALTTVSLRKTVI
jgi:hypothetical protein